jgi:hypothetical protein
VSGAALSDETDEFGRVIAAAQADIATSIERAGLRDDPYRYPLAALSVVLGLFPEFVEQLRNAARQPLDAAALDRLVKAAATGAEKKAAALARAHNRKTLALAAAVLAGVALACCGGGYWIGRHAAVVSVRLTEAGVGEAFRDPANAAQWLALMRANDIRRAVGDCEADRLWRDPSGRRACALHVWLDPPARTVPAK